jgi:Fe2+ or Zn2+ uptake regulation protein
VAFATPDPSVLLREHGLRVTAARVAVLSAIARQPHARADEIAAAARDHLGALSSAAVYEVLNTFTEVGLVRRIEPAGSPAPCLEPSNANGFVIEQAEVTWWGICANCNTNSSS